MFQFLSEIGFFIWGILPYQVNLILCLILIFHLLPRIKNLPYKLPPGPMGLPFVGFHPFLGSRPELVLEKLRNKYGNVLGFYIGSEYVVVISDFDSLKDAYNQKPFLGRPPLYFRTSPYCKNFGEMSDYETWVDHRKFAINTLKTLGMGKSRLEEMITEELSIFLIKMSKMSNQPKVNIRDILTPAINNGILRLICNKSLDDEDKLMKQLAEFEDLASESYVNTSPVYFYPWLRPFILKFSPRLKVIVNCVKVMETFIREEIDQHEKNFDENQLNDYIDFYLDEMRKGAPPSFTKDTLVNNSMFLLLAGSDTVRNTLEWCVLIMTKFPDIQEKVHQEIKQVIGLEKRPTWSDKVNLPYTESVIMEVERWRSLTVLSCTRMVTEDTKLKGYDIPKGTHVMNSIYACHMNPKEWDQPEVFNPDRFLSEDKKRAIMPSNLILFSYGRRDCPGDKMAKMEVYLYFSALLQKFKFVPPQGGLSLECWVRINAQSSYPIISFENR